MTELYNVQYTSFYMLILINCTLGITVYSYDIYFIAEYQKCVILNYLFSHFEIYLYISININKVLNIFCIYHLKDKKFEKKKY
jgi:hypothetical protein